MEAAPLHLPEKDLSEYEILSTLGEGGFSRVVLAKVRSSGQQVALKICLQYNAHSGTEVLEVLPTCEVLKEAALHRTLAAGQHSIVPVLDAFQCKVPLQQTSNAQEQPHHQGSSAGAEGNVQQQQPSVQMAGCIVMPIMQGNLQEWLVSRLEGTAGKSLSPNINNSAAHHKHSRSRSHGSISGVEGTALPQRAVVKRLVQMMNAVRAVHAGGMVHRDIKLSNFLIDPRDGSLRLCDFGCAAPVTPQAPSSGQSGQVMGGTAWAMSPQRLQGLDDGPAGDWWALGIALYSLVMGDPHAWPFKRSWKTSECKSEAAVEAMLRKAATAGAIQGWPPNVSPALKAAVTGLLSPDPGQRWGLDELLKATDLLPDSLLLDMATEMPALGADMRLLLEMRRQLLSGAPQANNNLGNNSSVPVTATAQPKEKGAHGTAVGARGGGDDASDAASLLPHNGTSSSGDVARPTGNAGGKHTVQNPLCGAVGSGSEDGGGQGAAQGPHPRISRPGRVHDCASEVAGMHLTPGPAHLLAPVDDQQDPDPSMYGASPDRGRGGCFGVLCGLGRSHSAGHKREKKHSSPGQASMYVKAMF